MTGTRYAILIGCQNFPEEAGLQDLRCPLNDVRGMDNVLADNRLGDCQTIVLENPTEKNVRRTIAQVCTNARRQDTIFIYYSGHGKPDRSGTLHLITSDTELKLLEGSAVSLDFVKASIGNSDAQNAVLLLDCCYSGAAGQAFTRGQIEDQLNVVNQGSGIFIMSASTEYQTAQEKEEDEFGVFTKHLIEGVRSGEADQDRDGIITMQEIYDYVWQKVTAENHQEPKKWEIGARGNILFSKSGQGSWNEVLTSVRGRIHALEIEGVFGSDFVTEITRFTLLDREVYTEHDRERAELLKKLAAESISSGKFRDQWDRVNNTTSTVSKTAGWPGVQIAASILTFVLFAAGVYTKVFVGQDEAPVTPNIVVVENPEEGAIVSPSSAVAAIPESEEATIDTQPIEAPSINGENVIDDVVDTKVEKTIVDSPVANSARSRPLFEIDKIEDGTNYTPYVTPSCPNPWVLVQPDIRIPIENMVGSIFPSLANQVTYPSRGPLIIRGVAIPYPSGNNCDALSRQLFRPLSCGSVFTANGRSMPCGSVSPGIPYAVCCVG